MKCHQILTGAANKGDRTFDVGTVEGTSFTAYASGCNIVILAPDFQRVQILPGICHDNVQIASVACSQDSGKIAASYNNTIIIFEPSPLEEKNTNHGLDFWWVETDRIESEWNITTLCWNNDGNRLLTAGEYIQLWHHEEQSEDQTGPVTFNIDDQTANDSGRWRCLWRTRPANPVFHLVYSPDGTLFATASKHDRLVRVWYQNQQLLFPREQTSESVRSAACSNSISFSYVYLAHPRSVTGISWRKTSKYMPKGSVANMLVTSCLDNICRMWCETVLPEDGIVCMSQLDPAAAKDSKFRTHRQKARFIQRFRHMRQSFAARKLTKNMKTTNGEVHPDPVTSLPSTYSVHEFHNYGFHGTGVSPTLHFHLAASINARTDIPLVPTLNASHPHEGENQLFVVHWLDNKEMQFTQDAERIMDDLFRLAKGRQDLDLELSRGRSNGHHDDGGSDAPPRPPPPKRPPHPSSKVADATSNSSIAQSDDSNNVPQPNLNLSDMLDHRIDQVLKDWHQSSDLLFAVHPVDGSFLVWVADFLDEYQPGSFRQAQVSFSSRIPNALPLGDAITMGTHVELFNGNSVLDLKGIFGEDILNGTNEAQHDDEKDEPKKEEEDQESSPEPQQPTPPTPPQSSTFQKYKPPPIVSLISKHSNGTLNLWNMMFAEKSKFAQLLNVSHNSRASGHRFRVNGITCHPVLPLLLTTSHHNLIHESEGPISAHEEVFCSELILWRVDPVGPLSKSGGITELARINSKEISAFADVAWIPTLLPSTSLGSISNSPSACFVASDGECLRVYQAVIDARTLLAEITSSSRKSNRMESSMMSMSSGHSTNVGAQHGDAEKIHEKFRIVSTQSSAKPGAILELEAITEATQDWQSTVMLHAFQEQLILAQGTIPSSRDAAVNLGLITSKMSAVVDLDHQGSAFHEPFYVLVAEKTREGVVVHMWKLVIASEPECQDGADSSGSITPDGTAPPIVPQRQHSGGHATEVHVSTKKVCVQTLPLPPGVDIIDAVPAVGHLSSSSIYPACLAPYVMVTACTDKKIRFWRVKLTGVNPEHPEAFEWEEWQMESEDGKSEIEVPGTLVSVSAAYSGRIACAYQTGHSFQRPNVDPTMRYVNLCVRIYECESTGGSEWIVEDTISLKNIEIQPEIPAMDMSVFSSTRQSNLEKITQHFQDDQDGEEMKKNLQGLVSVPSMATFEGIKRYISNKGNSPSPVSPKQSVILDWVSNEDGSHILTVAVGNKILLLTTVSSELAAATQKANLDARGGSGRPLLSRSSSMGFQQFPDEIRWMQIRRVALKTADGLNPTPMAMSWVRDGILMCAMDNEISVFSQWRADPMQNNIVTDAFEKDIVDHRNLQETELLNLAQETQLSHGSFSNLNALPALKHFTDSAKRKKGVYPPDATPSHELDLMPDFGLFEAAHIACPVLPQYHPKQLMELLNSGKIRWVKAILGHLVRCIGGSERARRRSGSFNDDSSCRSPRSWSKSRTLSVSYGSSGGPGGGGGALSPGGENPRSSLSAMPEELTLDYTEINSIPPLPLWTLLAADQERSSPNNKQGGEHYDSLFDGGNEEEDTLEDLLEDDFDGGRRKSKRKNAGEKQGLSYFGPRQARILSNLLTHAHLPGLSSLDQMHLLALADTVSSIQLDLADRFAIETAKMQLAKETASSSEGPSPESLDDCGLRFLLSMKHYSYLQRCLPLKQRTQMIKQGLGSSYFVWGFHSESDEELLNMIPNVAKSTPNWQELRELGTGWWLRNNTTLRKLMEKVAKTAFQAKQDPLDAAIFYLAMKKKSLVWGLFRSIKDEKMTQFFSNNFSEDRWRKAALKNAFALLGKQRFMHAAAFFLLSGSLKDALDICIDKLDDLQLAMVIARLYDGETTNTPESLVQLLNKHVLGRDPDGENEDKDKVHPDPFLRSIAHWIQLDYSQSLATLVELDVGTMHSKFVEEENDSIPGLKRKQDADPSVFNFYIYLRTHPLIARHQIAKKKDKDSSAIQLSGFRSNSKDKESTFSEDAVTPLERRLYFSTAHFHLRAGCPALALEVLSKLPGKVMEAKSGSATPKTKKHALADTKLATGTFDHGDGLDWSQPMPTKKHEPEPTTIDWGSSAIPEEPEPSLDLDWSQPVVDKDEDELKLEWSDDADSDDEAKSKKAEDVKPLEEDEEHEHTGATHLASLDIMAQQLKFIACLKIMMEELSTLATGFEVDGGLLRYQLYIWLEREVEALKQLCSYGATDVQINNTQEEDSLQSTMRELFAANGRRPTLHEVMMAEKVDFEAKINRAIRRKQWLRANQTLLRTLLSYCGLHGANGGGLASVRMELILLLQELQQEKTQKQLLSPLPFPTTLPLLSACIAQQKTVVTDPIRHLQAMTHDMLDTIVNQSQPPLPSLANYGSIFLLKDLSVALSSCIYQSLCDSDSINMKKLAAKDGPASAILEALSRLSVVYQDSSLISTSHGRKMSYDETTEISTDPSKWPGVTSLRALLDREKDEETPNLNVLLCETYVAIYISLLSYALASCDAQILYRLISQNVSPNYWSHIFGGGAKKRIKIETAHVPLAKELSNEGGSSLASDKSESDLASQSAGEHSHNPGILNTMTSLTKQRVKLNIKVLGMQLGNSQESGSGAVVQEKQSYREHFMPPDKSIISQLISKPILDPKDQEIDCDSGEENDENESDDDTFEDDDPFSNIPLPAENREHSDANSYSWCLMRYASIRLAQGILEKFITMAGIELPAPLWRSDSPSNEKWNQERTFEELPVASPLIYASLRITESWLDSIQRVLNKFGKVPDNYIPGCYPDPNATGKAIEKYKCLFEPQNTPFVNRGHGIAPIKRLWQYLVRQPPVQRLFVKYIFSRSPINATGYGNMSIKSQNLPESQSYVSRLSAEAAMSVVDEAAPTSEAGTMFMHQVAKMNQPVKIIHRDHEAITAFCINKVSSGLMTISTQKEIQELNISLLLNPMSWNEGMNDEADFDVLSLEEDPESLPASNYLVIQTPGDIQSGIMPGSTFPGVNPSQLTSPNGPPPPPFGPAAIQQAAAQNKGASVVKRHQVTGVRRLAAHSHLPLYVTGCQDGSIKMWEWSHGQAVQSVRPPGVFAKVNRVRFTAQGNKFGACDGDGTVALWQAANASQPFFTMQCHTKQTSDFVFQGGSSSLFCTAGHNTDGKNVAMWDTLMPHKRAMAQSFTFHESGASSILYAPQRVQLVTGGKRGQVSIWDVRQQKQLHYFKAHDQAIKCMALDPNEEFFVTGSVAGDIKIWSLSSYKCFHTFAEEHSRQGIFKNISQGVSQVFVDSNARLFSCGADGSMKVRQLPDRDFIVNAL